MMDPEHERLHLRMAVCQEREHAIRAILRLEGGHLLRPGALAMAEAETSEARGEVLRWYHDHPEEAAKEDGEE